MTYVNHSGKGGADGEGGKREKGVSDKMEWGWKTGIINIFIPISHAQQTSSSFSADHILLVISSNIYVFPVG